MLRAARALFSLPSQRQSGADSNFAVRDPKIDIATTFSFARTRVPPKVGPFHVRGAPAHAARRRVETAGNPTRLRGGPVHFRRGRAGFRRASTPLARKSTRSRRAPA